MEIFNGIEVERKKMNRGNGYYYIDVNGNYIARTCSQCNEFKSFDKFHKSKKGFNGHASNCKECRSIKIKNREYEIIQIGDISVKKKLRQSGKRKYYYIESLQNKEVLGRSCSECKIIKLKEEFYVKKGQFANMSSRCKECSKVIAAEWYGDNRERARENARQYHIDNAEKIRERVKQWKVDNPEKRKKGQRNWYEKNRELIIQRMADWIKNNRGQFNQISKLSRQRRRARLEALPDNLTVEEFDLIHNTFNNQCHFTDSSDVHLDHVIPLSIGHGGTYKENLILLSSTLNTSKQDSNIFEWFKQNKDYYKLSQSKFDNLIEYIAEQNELTLEEYKKFVYWCFDNPRTVDEIKADNERYGYKVDSITLWKDSLDKEGVA